MPPRRRPMIATTDAERSALKRITENFGRFATNYHEPASRRSRGGQNYVILGFRSLSIPINLRGNKGIERHMTEKDVLQEMKAAATKPRTIRGLHGLYEITFEKPAHDSGKMVKKTVAIGFPPKNAVDAYWVIFPEHQDRAMRIWMQRKLRETPALMRETFLGPLGYGGDEVRFYKVKAIKHPNKIYEERERPFRGLSVYHGYGRRMRHL